MADKRTIMSIKEAFQGFECPICSLLKTMNQDHIRITLYESVNDRTLRKTFLKDQGFCGHHAQKVLALGAPLNHAILYDALLEDKLKHYNKDKPLPKNSGCIFCEKEKNNEAFLLKSFVDGFEQTDFIEAYKNDGLLCFTHLEPITQQLKKNREKKHQLKSINLEKYDKLSNILKSIKQKHDYRNTAQTWSEEERNLWRDAVKLLITNNDHRL